MRELTAKSKTPRTTGRPSLTVLPVAERDAPPACLQRCLQGTADNLRVGGCAWLQTALAGHPDPGLLDAGHCDQGLRVAANVSRLHDQSVVLISMLASDDSAAALPGAADAQLAQLRAENEGLADEVLRNYEQLSLIFDFTQRIANITHVDQIEHLLLERIGALLHVETVRVGTADQTIRVYDVPGRHFLPDEQSLPAGRLGWLDEIRGFGTGVRVRHDEAGQAMGGVLQRLEERIEVVLVQRDASAADFNAGDIQILEALLTFGGQILTNNELHQRLRQMSIEATRALVSAIDKKDHYTFGHSERVGFLARMTGVELGLPDGELETLEWAGLLHDVGKIGVPEEILSKPGKLTDEEFEIVKKHPEMGYEILKPISDFKHILEGVLYHHENPDGTGYPHGLSGDEIPLFAGVLHVVDVFDALTSRRSYRDAFSTDRAIGILNAEAGTKLNAQLVDAFLRALARFEHDDPTAFVTMFPSAQFNAEQS